MQDVARLIEDIENKSHIVGIVGLGYVGIPLMLSAADAGFKVIGFDVDEAKIVRLNQGLSDIAHLSSEAIRGHIDRGLFEATADFGRISECDSLLIAVPTPLTKNREPDLSFVVSTTKSIAENLRPGQLVVLESTTWPGTTIEVMKPILEATGLRSQVDFFLAYSPEREDPASASHSTTTIPKVVGGDGPDALRIAQTLYGEFVDKVVAVSSPQTAEAVKLTENIFRAVNIALVNELKVIFGRMGVDVWEVIEAAKTKPFGFMPFYPGPGLGGHCIPIDPFYLTWKAREFDLTTRFIELAGEVNAAMPRHVVGELREALDRTSGKGLRGARILLVGIAYKKNVDDMRESPSLTILEMLEGHGAIVDYHDPFIPVIPATREHAALKGRQSVALEPNTLAEYDAVFVATDHDGIDWQLIADHAKLVIDTRNAFGKEGIVGDQIKKA